ncbi:MAG: Aminodeoxychorismate synthase, partial [Sediminibacterium sp.]|nr:Aminodeoxychorismate synthase [Sediminibacterium sp.]
YQEVECLVAAGAADIFQVETDTLSQFRSFCRTHNDWLFGHINYDLKNEIENLHSSHPDPIGFPTMCFFQPEVVLQLANDQLTISALTWDPVVVFSEITNHPQTPNPKPQTIPTHPRISKEEYLITLKKILQHIRRGDCYELNFCQEFFAEEVVTDPLGIYAHLTALSPNPFSCFYKLDERYLLCASPERYLRKKGNRLTSQPIKGTFSRNHESAEADELLKQQLHNSEKDRSENVMVVDLVRNDLSRVCREGTVTVDELFGVYSFPQVHQMISTISGELKEGLELADILAATFPMGSMTGAPKRRVMELIEQYEKTKRGIYSGAVGYISPEKDFDFNVVIRSILYNASGKYLSYLVGGGITFYSDPEKEYEECLLKAEAIRNVLQGG